MSSLLDKYEAAFKTKPTSLQIGTENFRVPTIVNPSYMPLKEDQCGLLKNRYWKQPEYKEDAYGNLWYLPGRCAKGSECITKEDKDMLKKKCFTAAQTLDKSKCKLLGNRWLDVDGLAIIQTDGKGDYASVTNGLCIPTNCNYTEECKEMKKNCSTKKCSRKRRSTSRKRRSTKRRSRH